MAEQIVICPRAAAVIFRLQKQWSWSGLGESTATFSRSRGGLRTCIWVDLHTGKVNKSYTHDAARGCVFAR